MTKFTDGPEIPAAILGELKLATENVVHAKAAIEVAEGALRDAQRKYVKATSVQEFFVDRVKAELKLKDGDKLNLDRGVVELASELKAV